MLSILSILPILNHDHTMVKPVVPKPAAGNTTSIAAQYAQAMARQGADKASSKELPDARRHRDEQRFKSDWCWTLAIFVFFL